MKINQKGFSAVEGIIIIVIVVAVGIGGWYVGKSHKDAKTSESQSETQATSQNSTNYDFKELGISMNILDGWNVLSEPSQYGGGNYYKWTISKASADGKIVLESRGFIGGFESCGFSPVTVNEVAPTKNAAFMFINYQTTRDGKANVRTSIVPTNGSSFKLTNDENAAAINNAELNPGTYYYCASGPAPDFDLGLNKEPSPGYARLSNIFAFSTEGMNEFLKPTAKSYKEIKTMMTSIR